MPESKQSLKELLYDIRRIEEHRETLTNAKIEKIYKSLQKNLNAFLADEYLKYADADGRFYVSYLDAVNKKASFLNEIVKNVDGITPEIKKELTTLVDKVYTESYKGMLNALQTAEKDGKFAETVKDLSVQKDVLNQAVNNNISKLTLPQVLEKHRAEIIYQIQQELNIGLMLGDRYEDMAKRISKRIGVSKSKAMNITRTETHRNIEGGFMDCAEDIQSSLDGYDVIYAAIWHNMGDERVRPNVRRKTKHGWKTYISHNGANHIAMEGQTVKVGDLFDLGDGFKTKAPCHSGNAADDCNCRCYLEYKLMSVEEFEKATGKKVDKTLVKGDEKYYNSSNRVNPITDSSIENLKEIQIDGLTAEQSKYAYEQRLKLFKAMQEKEAGYEGSITFLFDCSQASDVRYGEKGTTKIYTSEYPYYVLHNHPDDGVLSPQDLLKFTIKDNMMGFESGGNSGKVISAIVKTNDCKKDSYKNYLETQIEKFKKENPDYDKLDFKILNEFSKSLLKKGADYGYKITITE